MLSRFLSPSRDHSGREGEGISQLTQSPTVIPSLQLPLREGSLWLSPLSERRVSYPEPQIPFRACSRPCCKWRFQLFPPVPAPSAPWPTLKSFFSCSYLP